MLGKGFLTPTNRTGRLPVFSCEQMDVPEAFIILSKNNRQMSYFQLAHFQFPHWSLSERVIKTVLNSWGYDRHIARVKPPLLPEHMETQKKWAGENHF